jgi:hypothetical protein
VSLNATDSPAIDAVRAAVPEFEQPFQAELADEDGELGPFQAISLFARWVAAADDDVARRALDVVERLIEDRGLELGDALAAEFIEAVAGDPRVLALMGPRTRERADAPH